MQAQFDSGLVWFRRDLRTFDNISLCKALMECRKVFCVFIFDRDILDSLPRVDQRVEFIRESLIELDAQLKTLSSKTSLRVVHGWASEEIPKIASALGVQRVYAGNDYEPNARARDIKVKESLQREGANFVLSKEHVVFEEQEVLTQGATPYGVFTPYKNAWLAKLSPEQLTFCDPSALCTALAEWPGSFSNSIPSLSDIGFETSRLQALAIPTGASGAQKLLIDFLERIDRYNETRDFPAVKGPSYLSMHLRFGTISIRQLVSLAWPKYLQGSIGASVWLSELIWREFYFQILYNFPHVAKRSYRPAYDAIQWEEGEDGEKLFNAWCTGQTGYPLVDAAMAQLNQTGYMHNRLRMVTGSFLVKDLGIDWRRGESYFAEKLNDFDLSANNGGWQWVSSSGCDAQPYFRIFNPVSQSEKFDPAGKFIRRYLPQLAKLPDKLIHAPWKMKPLELKACGIELGVHYPEPVISHEHARAKTLLRYSVVKK